MEYFFLLHRKHLRSFFFFLLLVVFCVTATWFYQIQVIKTKVLNCNHCYYVVLS